MVRHLNPNTTPVANTAVGHQGESMRRPIVQCDEHSEFGRGRALHGDVLAGEPCEGRSAWQALYPMLSVPTI